MSDGRFAVLGGYTSSCEVLAFDDGDAHWAPLPPMHDARAHSACQAVAGGNGRKSAEVYDEELNRWLRLPCDLPHDLPHEGWLAEMGSAVL
jgi:hypothetical protein